MNGPASSRHETGSSQAGIVWKARCQERDGKLEKASGRKSPDKQIHFQQRPILGQNRRFSQLFRAVYLEADLPPDLELVSCKRGAGPLSKGLADR